MNAKNGDAIFFKGLGNLDVFSAIEIRRHAIRDKENHAVPLFTGNKNILAGMKCFSD